MRRRFIAAAAVISLCLAFASAASAGKLENQLIDAVQQGNAPAVRVLLAEGADVNANRSGWPALMYAAGNGKTNIVKLLLDKGANIEAKNIYGSTALIIAAYNGHADVVTLLLAKGANIEAKDNDGNTALANVALSFGREDVNMVKLLLEKGANIDAKNKNGETALMLAAMEGRAAVVKLLLDKGTDVNTKDNNRNTALMWAASPSAGYAEIVKLLLDKGADVEAKNNTGETALILAIMSGRAGVFRALFERGARCDWDIKNDLREKIIKLVHGMTPPLKIPDDAKHYFIKGNTFIKEGKDASAVQNAIDAYIAALRLAPWWGNAYFNLGLAYEAAGRYKEAEESMNFFLLTKPGEAWKDKAEQELGKIEAEEKLQSESN